MIIVLYVRVELRRECLVVWKFVLVKLAITYSCPAISIQSNYFSIILVQFEWSFSSSIFWFLFSSYYTSHCTLSFKNGDSIACRVEMCAERVKFFYAKTIVCWLFSGTRSKIVRILCVNLTKIQWWMCREQISNIRFSPKRVHVQYIIQSSSNILKPNQLHLLTTQNQKYQIVQLNRV